MNWKHKTILGAIAGSGEFEVQIDGNNFEFVGLSPHPNYIKKIISLVWYNYSGQLVHTRIEDCKLIARHVDSITDEELRHYQYEIPLKDISIGNNLTMETPEPFLYLLSIGVLPESLADEDVIWK